MAIDTSIQLNGHNSYYADERFWADPFHCSQMAYITASVALYAVGFQATADKIIIRFYSDKGAKIAENTHQFESTPMWTRVYATAEVPTGAAYAQFAMEEGDYWWAEAKTEEGETATAYAVNAAGQLTWITANGIYTGTISTKQIILAGGETLTERLTLISAGMATFVKEDDLGIPGKTVIDGRNIKTGTINFDNATGVNVNLSGTIKSTSGAIAGYEITPTGLRKSIFHTFGPFTQSDIDTICNIIMSGNPPTKAQLAKYDFFGSGKINSHNSTEAQRMMQGITSYTKEYTVELNTTNRLEMVKIYSPSYPDRQPTVMGAGRIESPNVSQIGAASGTFQNRNIAHITVEDGIVTNVFTSGPVMALYTDNQRHQIGVDSSGPYYVKNNVKTYF